MYLNMTNFNKDAAAALPGELKVMEVLASKTNDFSFSHIDDQEVNGKKGDILAIEKKSGKAIYIEVKNDSRISQTGNVLCEYQKYYYDSNKTKAGSMFYNYEIYLVHSQDSRTLYVIDFKKLRTFYTILGDWIQIEEGVEITYGFLVRLKDIIRYNALLYTIEY